MKVLFLGYREWALNAFERICSETSSVHELERLTSNDDIVNVVNNINPDIVFLAGWSWLIPKEICEKYFCVGIHPSDLPDYAGGSPLQHQIIDGLTSTKASLFRVVPKLDAGGVLLQKTMSLKGHMKDVFQELSRVTCELFNDLMDTYPNVQERHNERSVLKKRLKPEDSKITKRQLSSLSTLELYNIIRCREEPYPNVYVEDETGRLYFESVRFESEQE